MTNQLKSHRFALRSAQVYLFILTSLSLSLGLLAGFNRADLLYPTLKKLSDSASWGSFVDNLCSSIDKVSKSSRLHFALAIVSVISICIFSGFLCSRIGDIANSMHDVKVQSAIDKQLSQ